MDAMTWLEASLVCLLSFAIGVIVGMASDR